MASRVAVGSPPGAAAPAPASGKWSWRERSAQFFCLIILLGFPVFSVPCQKGICSSPLEVVATYGYCKTYLSDDLTRYILYPASLMLKMEVLMGDDPQSFKFPEWDGLLSNWNLTSKLIEKEKTTTTPGFRFPSILTMYESADSQRLRYEFAVVCVVCLAGAVTALAGPNRVAFAGMVAVVWYLFVEGGKRQDVSAQPMLVLAMVCSLGWVNFKELFSFPRNEVPAEPSSQSSSETRKQE